MSILVLDFVSQRYGQLPSKVLESGDVLDVRVAEIASDYASWLQKNPNTNNTHGFTTEQLLAQMEVVRNGSQIKK